MQAAGFDEPYKELDQISPSAADRDHTVDQLQLGSKFAGTTIYKIAAQQKRHAKEIDMPKFIRDADDKLLTRDEDILRRWQTYCDGLLNEEFPRRYFPTATPNKLDLEDATEEEVYEAVKNSKIRKQLIQMKQ